MLPMLSELDEGPAKLSIEPDEKDGDKLLDEPAGVNCGPELD